MAATRREVAVAANVSLRTVSNVVNGFASVAPGTRERVLRVIEELDYRPSEVARMLKRGRTGLVALVLPELDTPYFAELTRSVVELGTRQGLTVVIDQTDGDPARELELINQAERGSLFDGLIVSPLGLRSSDLERIPSNHAVVFLGEESHPRFDQVRIDNFAAAYEAVGHLLSQGRRRIAAIGAEPHEPASSVLRLDGYKKAIHDAGVGYDPALVGYVKAFRLPDGAAAMTQLLESGTTIDAVFCFADPLALGAMHVMNQRGVRVPEDVAVVGFDDIEYGRYAAPSLTSVSPDKLFIAQTALELLVARINGSFVAPTTYLAPHQLIVRDSSR